MNENRMTTEIITDLYEEKGIVPEEYQFSSFSEFYVKGMKIKKWFSTLPKREVVNNCCTKEIYKMFVFSRCNILDLKKEDMRDIWEWLDSYHTDETLRIIYEKGGKNR